VRELSNLSEAPRCFCAKASFWNGGGKGGNRIRNAATGDPSETWNREVNTFRRWDKILLPRTPPRPAAMAATWSVLGSRCGRGLWTVSGPANWKARSLIRTYCTCSQRERAACRTKSTNWCSIRRRRLGSSSFTSIVERDLSDFDSVSTALNY
jgi:hypothetical protein